MKRRVGHICCLVSSKKHVVNTRNACGDIDKGKWRFFGILRCVLREMILSSRANARARSYRNDYKRSVIRVGKMNVPSSRGRIGIKKKGSLEPMPAARYELRMRRHLLRCEFVNSRHVHSTINVSIYSAHT